LSPLVGRGDGLLVGGGGGAPSPPFVSPPHHGMLLSLHAIVVSVIACHRCHCCCLSLLLPVTLAFVFIIVLRFTRSTMPAGVSGCRLAGDHGCGLGGGVHVFGSAWGHDTDAAVHKHVLGTVGYISM